MRTFRAKGHEDIAAKLSDTLLTPDVRAEEDKTSKRMFVLQYVQPGLAGLMDGSVSTLAPLFAAAFATHHNWQTFLVGLAASIGAGISMGFAEALSDDGSCGRGRVRRTLGYSVRACEIHGYAVPPGRFPDRTRRGHCLGCGYPHWWRLTGKSPRAICCLQHWRTRRRLARNSWTRTQIASLNNSACLGTTREPEWPGGHPLGGALMRGEYWFEPVSWS